MAKKAKKALKKYCVYRGSVGLFSGGAWGADDMTEERKPKAAKIKLKHVGCFTTQKEARSQCDGYTGPGKKCKVVVNKHAGMKCCSWRKKCK